jgi:hypothetical protein
MTGKERATGDRRVVAVHGWIVVLTTLVTVGIASLLVLSQPVEYHAESEVELFSTPTRGAPIAPNMGTEREVALSGSVAREAAERMDATVKRARDGLSVSVVTDTEVMVLRFTARSAERAMDGVEAFTQSYASARNARQRERVVTVISPPDLLPVTSPESTPLLLAAGLLGGLGLGIALAFAWDRLSGRVRSAGELASTGLPVLASDLPLSSRGLEDPAVLRDSRAGYLAARVSAQLPNREGARILVAGAYADPTTAGVAEMTAGALAATGTAVLLVETEAPPGGRHRSGQRPGGPGFTDLLAGQTSPDEAARSTPVSGLRVMGPGAHGRAASYDSRSVDMALEQIAASQTVVVAGPPLLGSGGVWASAGAVDLVIVVAPVPELRRRDAQRLADLLSSSGVGAAGWVVPARPTRTSWIWRHVRRTRSRTARQASVSAPTGAAAGQSSPGTVPGR